MTMHIGFINFFTAVLIFNVFYIKKLYTVQIGFINSCTYGMFILGKFREHREKENFSFPVLAMYDINSNLN